MSRDIEQQRRQKAWNKYKIIDWAGNTCFGGQKFKTFEDAWGFIREMHPDEEDWQEYEVVHAGNGLPF